MTSERALIVGSLAAMLAVVAAAQLLGLARDDGDPDRASAPTTPATEPAPPAPVAGDLLAYSRDTADGEDVFLRDLFTGAELRLTSGAAREFDPDISPDRRLVAYRSNPDPASDAADIWIVGLDGAAPRNLTGDPGGDNWAPAWSPDGTMLAFSSAREDGTLALWTVRPDGSGLRRVTQEHCEYADWSPDGTQLVCAAPVGAGGPYDLWVVDAASGVRRQLTDTPETEFAPVWSPDGTRIAFQAAHGEEWAVETIAPDGSGRVRVSAGEGADPVWSPAGDLAWNGPGGLTVLDVGAAEPRALGAIGGRLPSWG
jgi:Tol biopolymer transport system component